MDNALISFCIPCMNRTYDLKVTMPYMIAAANASPPVEIAVLDYSSQDDLAEYMPGIKAKTDLHGSSYISYSLSAGRDYYHLAHAWNLAALASMGEYVCIMGTDAVLAKNYVVEARKLIAEGCVWMRGKRYKGILICAREEFISAGGYDERFEFYGKEDRDLEGRLIRRGSKFGLMPNELVTIIKTPNGDKLRNYRGELTKKEMSAINKPIWLENEARGVLVANEGVEWGQWGNEENRGDH